MGKLFPHGSLGFYPSAQTRVFIFKRRRTMEDGKFVARAMEDLLELTDRNIQILLREVSEEELVVALTDICPEVREKLLRNINDTLRTFIETDIQMKRPLSPQKVKEAQQHILEQASDLDRLLAEPSVDENARPWPWEERKRQELKDRLKAVPVSQMALEEITELMGEISILGARYVLEAWDEELPQDELNEKLLVLGLHMVAQNRDPALVKEVLEARMHAYLQQQETRCKMILAGIQALPLGHTPHVVRRMVASFY